MNKRIILVLLTFISFHCSAYKIGLLIVATGKYIQFVQPLIESAERYFCTNHQVTYFVFTNGELPAASNRVRIEQPHLGWPAATTMRSSMYYNHRDILKEMDYLFAADADMLFVDTVGDEILSDRVATLHPGYIGTKGTYERRSISTAYVRPEEGSAYFAGGFYGGSREEFLKMVRTTTENIMKDFANGVEAIWNDESHNNRYFIDNPPTCILSPSYCYSMNLAATNGRVLPYPKRLIALDKTHQSYRS